MASISESPRAGSGFRIRSIPMDRPWRWLHRGWLDIARAPAVSLTYGAAITIVSLLLAWILITEEQAYLLLPLTAGFSIVAPFLATGLYGTSKRLEDGKPATLGAALMDFKENAGQLSIIGVVLLLIHLAWVRFATLLFMLFFGLREITWDGLISFALDVGSSIPFLIIGTAVGFVLATVSFAIAVVSIPYVVDRPVFSLEAMATSVVATIRNWPAMGLWAAIIALALAIGAATFFVGFIILMPLIGHASWHAYRDVVPREGESLDRPKE